MSNFQHIEPLLHWLNAHPYWAGFVAFVICFSESLAIVGLLIPGVVAMTAIGALVGSGVIPFWDTMIGAVMGAVSGDTVSYFLGRYYHERIQDVWPFRRFPQLIHKGRNFFEKHGGKSLFLGRFAGPVRAITPVIAGMMNMKPLRFLIVSFLSSVAWAPSYMLPGFAIGAASQGLSPAATTHLFILIILVIIILWATSWIIRRLFAWKIQLLNSGLTKLWNYLHTKPYLRPLLKWVKDAENPTSHKPLSLLLASLVCVLLLSILAYSVMQHGYLTHLNPGVNYLFRGLRNPLSDEIMLWITFAGEVKVMCILLGVITLWLAYKKHYYTACCWFACGISSMGAASIIRSIVKSPRPSGLTVPPDSWSFPSGHTTLSVTLFGFLAVICARHLSLKYRPAPFIIAVSLIVLMILSRLYLGAHWLTDVIGGVLLGIASICFYSIFYYRKPEAQLSVRQFSIVIFTTILLTTSVYAWGHFAKYTYHYTPISSPMRIYDHNGWWNQSDHMFLPYSTNRVGQPVQRMNIQWVDQLTTIRAALLAQGFQDMTHSNIVNALKSMLLPSPPPHAMFAQLYQDRRAILIMTKMQPNNRFLLVQIWPSNIMVKNKPDALPTPLWVGTIGYPKLHKQKEDNNNPTAIEAFTTYLMAYEFKRLQYPELKSLNQRTDLNWTGYILLIQPQTK